MTNQTQTIAANNEKTLQDRGTGFSDYYAQSFYTIGSAPASRIEDVRENLSLIDAVRAAKRLAIAGDEGEVTVGSHCCRVPFSHTYIHTLSNEEIMVLVEADEKRVDAPYEQTQADKDENIALNNK